VAKFKVIITQYSNWLQTGRQGFDSGQGQDISALPASSGHHGSVPRRESSLARSTLLCSADIKNS
jgi:hypothetical protein